jgi:hypothetical protein
MARFKPELQPQRLPNTGTIGVPPLRCLAGFSSVRRSQLYPCAAPCKRYHRFLKVPIEDGQTLDPAVRPERNERCPAVAHKPSPSFSIFCKQRSHHQRKTRQAGSELERHRNGKNRGGEAKGPTWYFSSELIVASQTWWTLIFGYDTGSMMALPQDPDSLWFFDVPSPQAARRFAYGHPNPAPSQFVDLYLPADERSASKGLVVFIHG